MEQIINKEKNKNYMNDWIPCKERLPAEKQYVQVTYLGYYNGLPYCDRFAYMCEETWFWCCNDEEVIVEIVAWKPNCEPYKGD